MFVTDNMENMKKQQEFELKPVRAKSNPPLRIFGSDKEFNNGINPGSGSVSKVLTCIHSLIPDLFLLSGGLLLKIRELLNCSQNIL